MPYKSNRLMPIQRKVNSEKFFIDNFNINNLYKLIQIEMSDFTKAS